MNQGISDELIARATPIGTELAWLPQDAVDVINYLCDHDLAVLGIEIWIPGKDGPQVWGWSDYKIDFSNWQRFVEDSCARALSEMKKLLPNNAIVNMTWVSESEYAKSRR